jgi:arachidonate 5-lipoxygenase
MHKLVKRYLGTKNHYGIHSGKWMVELCRYVCFEVTGNAGLTFRQLYAFNGRELCITGSRKRGVVVVVGPVLPQFMFAFTVRTWFLRQLYYLLPSFAVPCLHPSATNVSCMAEEYFHVKTAPDMRITDAVRMSVALPVLVQPVDYKGSIYVDGGLLCNYPVHAFDGWWLSLEPGKSRLFRLSKLDEASSFSIHSNKFGTHPNEKTLGFTIFSSNEPNRTEHWVCDGGGPPTAIPDTKLGLKAKRQSSKSSLIKRQTTRELRDAVQWFVSFCADCDTDGDSELSREEFRVGMRTLLISDPSAVTHLATLFGTTDTNSVFDSLDTNHDDVLSCDEIVDFVDMHWLDGDMTFSQTLAGHNPRHIDTLGDFIKALVGTLHFQVDMLTLNPLDQFRTVAIDTGYIRVNSFDVQDEDKKYALQCGTNATTAFLKKQARLSPQVVTVAVADAGNK